MFWTVEDLRASYEAASKGETHFVRPGTSEKVPNILDVLTIGPMLRRVGVCDANPLGGDKADPPRKIWRCAHQQADYTCAIYDKRPWMCHQYPKNAEGGLCEYTHCQSVDCPGHRSHYEVDHVK